MSLTMCDIRLIYEALDRDPGWKLVLLETSGDVFRGWLQRVLTAVFTRICESAEDVFWGVIA